MLEEIANDASFIARSIFEEKVLTLIIELDQNFLNN